MLQDRQGKPRWNVLVNETLQLPFIGVMLLVLFLMGAAALGSMYFSLWSVMRTFDLHTDPTIISLFTTVGITMTVGLLVLMPLVMIIGVWLTHKVAGPLVRIQAALERMARGDYQVNLALRKGDLLGDVAGLVNDLAASLREPR